MSRNRGFGVLIGWTWRTGVACMLVRHTKPLSTQNGQMPCATWLTEKIFLEDCLDNIYYINISLYGVAGLYTSTYQKDGTRQIETQNTRNALGVHLVRPCPWFMEINHIGIAREIDDWVNPYLVEILSPHTQMKPCTWFSWVKSYLAYSHGEKIYSGQSTDKRQKTEDRTERDVYNANELNIISIPTNHHSTGASDPKPWKFSSFWYPTFLSRCGVFSSFWRSRPVRVFLQFAADLYSVWYTTEFYST